MRSDPIPDLKLQRFSLETLIRFLARLRHRVEIHVGPPRLPRYQQVRRAERRYM